MELKPNRKINLEYKKNETCVFSIRHSELNNLIFVCGNFTTIVALDATSLENKRKLQDNILKTISKEPSN